jgi:hypothetical protein
MAGHGRVPRQSEKRRFKGKRRTSRFINSIKYRRRVPELIGSGGNLVKRA